ncbi:MAG: BNR-4 repeat-containing protein [Alphaproteobacteria bacterium]|nr:BNR-4 repeat-containing protein [Alphaproteobacteria bacterium]
MMLFPFGHFYAPDDAFSPLSLSPSFWMDPSDETTITHSANAVSAISDKSGNANHPSGITDVVTGGSIKTKNALVFNGTSSVITLPSSLYGVPAGNNTVFVVFQSDSASATSRRLFSGTTSGTRWGLLLEWQNTEFSVVNANSYNPLTITNAPNTDIHVAGLMREGTTLTSIMDDAETTAAKGADVTATALTIGNYPITPNGFYSGAIGEVLIFPRALTAAEKSEVVTYLMQKWTYIPLYDLATSGSVAANGAIVPLLNFPSGVYDSSQDTTFLAWQDTPDGTNTSYSIVEYDHAAGTFGTVNTQNSTSLYSVSNYHGPPSLCIDYEGYVHVFNGSHNSDQRHSVSSAAYDTSTMTQQTDIAGSYTYPRPIPVGEDIYLFLRGNYTDFDLYLRKTASLSSGAATWDAHVEIATMGSSTRFYMGEVKAVGTDIYIPAFKANIGDTQRDNVYLIIYDTLTSGVKNIGGTHTVASGSLPVSGADMDTYFRVRDMGTNEASGEPAMAIIDGKPHIVYWEGVNPTFTLYHIYWTGSAWSTPEALDTGAGRYIGVTLATHANGDLEVLYNAAPTRTYRRIRSGGTWQDIELVFDNMADVNNKISAVLNGKDELLYITTERSLSTSDVDGTHRIFALGTGGFLG